MTPVLAGLQAGSGGTDRVRLQLRVRGPAVHTLVGRRPLRGISARTPELILVIVRMIVKPAEGRTLLYLYGEQ